jgi:hypothetical protein
MGTSLTHLVLRTFDRDTKRDNIAANRGNIASFNLKSSIMARKQQSQNIDSLIQSINTITEDRCSLSEEDVKILDEAASLLQNLKRKKGKTNKDILQIVVSVVILLSKFFKK